MRNGEGKGMWGRAQGLYGLEGGDETENGYGELERQLVVFIPAEIVYSLGRMG